MKRSILFIISISLIAASLITLVVSMVYHAVLGDGMVIVAVTAGISAAIATAGIVFACLAGKEKGE